MKVRSKACRGTRSIGNVGRGSASATLLGAVLWASSASADQAPDPPAAANAQRATHAAELRWDSRGRLVEATNGSHASAYFYADSAESVLEIHDGSVSYYVGPNFELRDGMAVRYARVGEARIARAESPSLQRRLLSDAATSQGVDPRIDVGDAWLVADGGAASVRRHLYAAARRLLAEHGARTTYLHQDHLGSITMASGSGGRVLGERAFQPTGPYRAVRGYTGRHGFTGQPHDDTTQLIHFHRRELEPWASRWLSPDPLFLTDARACLDKSFECANGYQYVSNNAVDQIDPTGESQLFMVTPAGIAVALAHRVDGELTYVALGLRPGLETVTGTKDEIMSSLRTASLDFIPGRAAALDAGRRHVFELEQEDAATLATFQALIEDFRAGLANDDAGFRFRTARAFVDAAHAAVHYASPPFYDSWFEEVVKAGVTWSAYSGPTAAALRDWDRLSPIPMLSFHPKFQATPIRLKVRTSGG
ncbi:MAG: RHS repeat-associated core domain-containing protein [Myxococcales bacterium]